MRLRSHCNLHKGAETRSGSSSQVSSRYWFRRSVPSRNSINALPRIRLGWRNFSFALRISIRTSYRQRQEQLDEVRAGDGIGIASDNPVFQNIQIELTNVNVEIETLQLQAATQERRLQELRDLVDVLPEVEAELMRLTRDYDVTEVQYQSLLQRLDVAELSESAEQSDEVQFRIIDPPLLPRKPASPNRPLLLFGVLFVGLAAGGGLSFLVNQLRPVFHDSIALREATGFPVLGSVTVMRSHERQASRIRQLGAFGCVIVGLCAACVAVLLYEESGSLLIRSLLGRSI